MRLVCGLRSFQLLLAYTVSVSAAVALAAHFDQSWINMTSGSSCRFTQTLFFLENDSGFMTSLVFSACVESLFNKMRLLVELSFINARSV